MTFFKIARPVVLATMVALGVATAGSASAMPASTPVEIVAQADDSSGQQATPDTQKFKILGHAGNRSGQVTAPNTRKIPILGHAGNRSGQVTAPNTRKIQFHSHGGNRSGGSPYRDVAPAEPADGASNQPE